MKAVEYIQENWKYIAAFVVVIIVIVAIWWWWKKKDENTIVVTEATPEDIAKAKALVNRLHEELTGGLFGWSLNSDDDLYMEFAQQSNVVFALCFKFYKEQYNQSLYNQLKAEWVLGDVISVILDRAKNLNLQ